MHLINQLFVLLLGDGIFLGVYSHPRHTPREYFYRQQNNLEPLEEQYAVKPLELHHVARRDETDISKSNSPALELEPSVETADNNKKSIKKELVNPEPVEANFSNSSKINPSAIESAPTATNKVTTESTPSQNATSPIMKPNVNSLGVTERSVIVFSSIAVCGVCYYLYKRFRKTSQLGDNSLSFEPGEQFKYGILSSNESRDNYEMSNVPLTAQSDDEDELEIFDLEGRKHVENVIISKAGASASSSDRLLPKDVEILDLDLPGVVRTSHPQTMNDEDLLDLDDAIDEILTKPSNKDTNFNKSKNNEFFDNL